MLVNHITPPVRQFLIPEQHGFLSGRSTVTNLMVFQDYILEAFRRGRQVDCVYTDFSKCFDKIPHPQLFAKLREFGFHGELYQWLVSYLSGRRMMVRLKGYYSRPFATTSGTPQGSHIGPLIFLIYINGINSVFEGRVRFLLFADDVKMFVEVDDPNDCVELQTNLDRFQHWCSDNGLFLNLKKCVAISFSRSEPINFNYSLGGCVLARQTCIRDLGILFDSQLSFNSHIDSISSKSMKVLGFIKRNTTDFGDCSAIVLLFVALVRPILEYGSQVWSPFYASSRAALERVQNRFLRYLSFKMGNGYENVQYDSLMKASGLSSLEARRQWLDAVMLVKLVNNQIDCAALLSSINFRVPGRTTRSGDAFLLPHTPTNYLLNKPLFRLQRHMNYLLSTNEDLSCFPSSVEKEKALLRKIILGGP
ncbi:Retrotransposon protein [Nesidiocoris tenuis]|uniref:Retrotransposon protein n=1 Tax=Nesidiocoris tenuis TaxID=355587 RepID=A0ABN7AH13_9HEMI|nr:Retrotransposon protein [Nesidiocoris tenuis]